MKKQILFIGNSYTYYHNMPQKIFAPMAAAAGYPVEVHSVTHGGYRLQWFADPDNEEGQRLRETIRGKHFDWVVLQDHSLILEEEANAITLRACVPDNAEGTGEHYSLTVTVGGDVVEAAVSSYHTWVYGKFPFTNTPEAGTEHNFFDDVSIALDRVYPVGTEVIISREASDAADFYIIDFIETELVEEALPQPVTTRVHFYNSNEWGSVYAHVYNSDAEVNTSWPGMVATSEGDPSQTTLALWQVFSFAMLDLSKRNRWDGTY